MDVQTRTEIEAAAFRRLRRHLMEDRPDVQNIDLMTLAGFCRNCLARWYQEAAAEQGHAMTKEEAREVYYGMPYDDWRAGGANPGHVGARQAAWRARSPDSWRVPWRIGPEGQSCNG
jgi:uncharacterized protein